MKKGTQGALALVLLLLGIAGIAVIWQNSRINQGVGDGPSEPGQPAPANLEESGSAGQVGGRENRQSDLSKSGDVFDRGDRPVPEPAPDSSRPEPESSPDPQPTTSQGVDSQADETTTKPATLPPREAESKAPEGPKDQSPDKPEKNQAVLSGRVVEIETRAGIEGLTVNLRDAARGVTISVTSGPVGVFEASVPAPGTYFAWVERNLEFYVDESRVMNLAVVGGARRDQIELLVRSGIVLRGLVATEDKQPVANATVLLEDLLNDQGGDKGETTSDGDGRFLFAGKKPGGHFVARAVHHEYGFGESQPLLAQLGGKQQEFEVILRSGQDVQGRLLTSGGGAVDGLPVWLMRANGQRWRPIPGTRTESGSDGRFVIGNVPPGEFRFVVVTAETTRLRSMSFAVVEGEANEPLDILLGDGPEGFVEGRVTTPDGDALAREEVMAWGEGGDLSGGTSTDMDGQYRIDGLGPVSEVTVEARGFRHGRVRKQQFAIPVSASGVDFVLGKTASLTGRVLEHQTGEPVSSFHLHGPFIDLDVESPEGTFKVDGIQVSHGTFQFSAEGFLTTNYNPGEMQEGATISGVEIVLHPGDWLEGTVRSSTTGKPIAGARVKYLSPGEQPPGKLDRESLWTTADPFTDALGRFYLQGLPAGQPNSLLVWHPDYQAVVVQDSLDRTFEVILQQTASAE